MGIELFNKFLQANNRYSNYKIKHFDKIIIDASNLFFTVLERHKGRMVKSYPDSRNPKFCCLNVIKQCAYILTHAAKDIHAYLNEMISKYSPNVVYLVLDPLTTPDYIIKANDPGVNIEYLRILYPSVTVNDNTIIHASLKEQEQINRKGHDNTEEQLEQYENWLTKSEEMIKTKKEIGDEVFEYILKPLLRQRYRDQLLLFSNHNIIKLSHTLIQMIFPLPECVKLVRAKHEADLLITNLAREPVKTLVASKDTDYFVLLCQFPHCYVTNLLSRASVYYPNEIISDLLEDAFKPEYICRIPPLAGNDYTTHIGVLSFKDPELIKRFLNLDTKFDALPNGSKRKKLTRLTQLMDIPSPREITKIKDIDEAVRKFDIDYFRLYYQGAMIYLHWEYYGEYNEVKLEDYKLKTKESIASEQTKTVSHIDNDLLELDFGDGKLSKQTEVTELDFGDEDESVNANVNSTEQEATELDFGDDNDIVRTNRFDESNETKSTTVDCAKRCDLVNYVYELPCEIFSHSQAEPRKYNTVIYDENDFELNDYEKIASDAYILTTKDDINKLFNKEVAAYNMVESDDGNQFYDEDPRAYNVRIYSSFE